MKAFTILLLLSAIFWVSFQADYDPHKAFEMLRASSASYCSDSQLKNMGCGPVCNDLKGYTYISQYVYQIKAGQSISYSLLVNPSTKKFVASFRGSQGTQQIIDEIINGGYTKYDMYQIDNAVATKYFYANYKNNMRNAFLADIKKAIASYPDYHFYFVGHSLGGAFATLAVLDISLGGFLPKNRLHMYNYGCPRVGNVNFVKAVEESIGGEIFRIVHYKDIVPHVPPCIVNPLKNQCLEGSSHYYNETDNENLLYYAWHIAPEIFYDIQDSTTWRFCSKHEDNTCSDRFHLIETSISDHLVYLGVNTGCGGNNAFGEDILHEGIVNLAI